MTDSVDDHDAVAEARSQSHCNLGVGCVRGGTCYAVQNRKPEQCGLQLSKLDPIVLTSYELEWVLDNPAMLAGLMIREDMTYSEHESMSADVGPWPTKRYKQFYERGRALILKDFDPELWSDNILTTFGFTPNPKVPE